MAFLNRSMAEVHCKIVYYGPGFGGKTTNLEWIFSRLSNRGAVDMTRISTGRDRTLYFDLLPLDLGSIFGYRTRLHLYTVPGQPRYNASRRIILQGVDGIVFVADSHPEQLFWNRVSFENLRQNLLLTSRTLESIPLVMQYNKRDRHDAVAVDQLNRLLNGRAWPVYPSIATEGQGVLETLKAIVGIVVGELARGKCEVATRV
ncbi:MAG: gliding-motility protein MglA [Candidatus Eisenbacteria sp.]|nr:gliding-motility protein MglA [Candidatus Eisenbacteria bacterium]